MRRSLLGVAVGLAVAVSGLKPALADQFTVADIEVEGLQRVSAGTVFAAFPVNIGERVDETGLGDAIKSLFRTGLFTDIEASLGTSDPLDSDDDDGYIASLDPGESTTLTFELSATSDANPKMYAANIDFRYDDESDKSRMSDAYQIPIRVESGDDGGLLSVFSIAGVGLLGALLGAAAYVYRRNDRQWGN